MRIAICVCVWPRLQIAELKRDRVYAVRDGPVHLGWERVFLQAGRQEAKRGKRREKEDDC